MKTLILTVGLPRSGKTTWAREQNIPIVNRDSIRLALHGQAFLTKAEPIITILENLMVESLFLAGHEKVIIDATHITAKRRERWTDYISTLGSDYRLVLEKFSVSEEVCMQRAIDTYREDLIPVIVRMSQQLDIDLI